MFHPNLRQKVRDFYVSLLGCRSLNSPVPVLDIFEFEGGFILGVYYPEKEHVLPEEEHLKGMWLELKIENPAQMKKRLLDFGVKEVVYSDKAHFYFQAPGGQVFRFAPL